jgi:hypothetical protein
MKKHEANDDSSIQAILDHLNVCHDGSLRRISFIKDRKWGDHGGLAYPDAKHKDYEQDLYFVKCNIELELLLNSYKGALPKQVVILYFEEVRSFRFFQENTFDYSEIYEVSFHKLGEDGFEFVFRTRGKTERIEMLRIVCPKIICTELDE